MHRLDLQEEVIGKSEEDMDVIAVTKIIPQLCPQIVLSW